jgi:hypothetical protein
MKTAPLLPLLAVLLLAGCSAQTEVRYPQRYATVIENRTGAAVPDDAVARFTAFFEQMHEPGLEERVAALYAPEAYFSDTLYQTDDRDRLTKHFLRLQASGATLTVTVDDSVTSQQNLYLRWRMAFDFNVAGSERHSNTIGMTLLRFDEAGQVVLHQDFWDSTEGFYRHVPVLGGVLDTVGRRMGNDQ